MDAAVTTLKFENKSVIPTDPRTKLFLTVTVSTIMITGGTGGFMNLVRPCLMACPIVFLLLSRKWVDAARFAVTYAILFALELTVLPGRVCSSTTPQPKSPDENNKKRRVFLQLFKCYKNTRHAFA